MSVEDRRRWDAQYEREAMEGSEEPGPPPFLVPYAAELPRTGRALDVACGTGRAAVWLASRGLEVVGVDVSPVAVARARALADREGVAGRCTFAVADLDDGLPPGPQVDVVLCHLFRDPRLDAALVDRLLPGGLLAVSALSEVGAAPGRYRVRPGELPRAFGHLAVVAHGEGDGHAWLLARRPPVSAAG